MIELVVFDMIGTTVEASPRIPEAFREALRVAGIELSDADIVSVRGKSKREAISELLQRNGKAAELETPVYYAFQACLLDCYREGPVLPIAGAEDTLRWCRDHGIDVALTTGFDRSVASLLLSHLGWTQAVDTVVCNDEVDHGRPAPDLIVTAMTRLGHADVTRVASVGDTTADLEAGANAGTGLNVGVWSGAHERERLARAPHTVLLASVAALPALLAGHG